MEAYGVDISPEMLEVAKQKGAVLGTPITWREAASYRTSLCPQSITLVTAFNAIQWMPIPETLAEVGRVLTPGGTFAVYTRVWEQESEHVWGRWFPGYLDHSRAPNRQLMESLSQLNDRFRLERVRVFSFIRKATPASIREQTRRRHYSTLSRYSRTGFDRAYSSFQETLRANYAESDVVTYRSSYTLFVYRLY
jgi:ubiquinone/menaquinone biosynthesis C-methylase UbiE